MVYLSLSDVQSTRVFLSPIYQLNILVGLYSLLTAKAILALVRPTTHKSVSRLYAFNLVGGE